MTMHRAVCALLLLAVGCAGRASGSSVARPVAPAGGLEAAALPYQVLDARTGKQIDAPEFWAKLADARAVCVGEEHSNPHHHWVQLEVVKQLANRTPGVPRALGMEMFQRPFQGVLDDYAANRIDAAALRSRAGWEERWGYDWGFYGPTIDAAVAAGAKLLALNAPSELTKKVVRKGLDALTPEERAQLPKELVLDDPTHRAWFHDLMEGMGGAEAHAKAKEEAPDAKAEPKAPDAKAPDPAAPPAKDAAAMPTAEQIYTVQVIWDETMADGAAAWLAATPNGRAIILAGNGHCHDSAIVKRLARRGAGTVVSVRPVIDTDGQVAETLAKPMNDFVIVLQMPKQAE